MRELAIRKCTPREGAASSPISTFSRHRKTERRMRVLYLDTARYDQRSLREAFARIPSRFGRSLMATPCNIGDADRSAISRCTHHLTASALRRHGAAQPAGVRVGAGLAAGDPAPRTASNCNQVACGLPPSAYQQQKPPSTRRSTPVTKLAASDRRKTAGPTISSTLAMRCIGVCSSNSFVWWTISGRVFIGVAV